MEKEVDRKRAQLMSSLAAIKERKRELIDSESLTASNKATNLSISRIAETVSRMRSKPQVCRVDDLQNDYSKAFEESTNRILKLGTKQLTESKAKAGAVTISDLKVFLTQKKSQEKLDFDSREESRSRSRKKGLHHIQSIISRESIDLKTIIDRATDNITRLKSIKRDSPKINDVFRQSVETRSRAISRTLSRDSFKRSVLSGSRDENREFTRELDRKFEEKMFEHSRSRSREIKNLLHLNRQRANPLQNHIVVHNHGEYGKVVGLNVKSRPKFIDAESNHIARPQGLPRPKRDSSLPKPSPEKKNLKNLFDKCTKADDYNSLYDSPAGLNNSGIIESSGMSWNKLTAVQDVKGQNSNMKKLGFDEAWINIKNEPVDQKMNHKKLAVGLDKVFESKPDTFSNQFMGLEALSKKLTAIPSAINYRNHLRITRDDKIKLNIGERLNTDIHVRTHQKTMSGELAKKNRCVTQPADLNLLAVSHDSPTLRENNISNDLFSDKIQATEFLSGETPALRSHVDNQDPRDTIMVENHEDYPKS